MEKEEQDTLTGLPEWVWKLRAAWTATKTYQTIRDGITDSIMPPQWIWRRKIQRRRFDPDFKLKLYHNSPTAVPLRSVSEFNECGPYVYDPPPAGHIRLLHLQPGHRPQAISITLSSHSINELPRYEALSYTWGDKIDHTIGCAGYSFSVQQNLWLALQTLRLDTVERTLWVDAICINQADVKEKNAQIPLMRSIYQKAQKVIVWLGEASDETADTYDLLSVLATLSSNESSLVAGEPMTAEKLASSGLPEASCMKWKALDALFWRDWCTRVWIIQEIALAKEITVVCGDFSCPWETFQAAAEYISEHSVNALTKVDPRRALRLAGFRSILGTREDQTLFELVLQARDSYSTDDRDKVYALQGLVSRVDDSFPNPDYSTTTSAAKVYTELARSLIMRGCLDVLSAVEDHSYRLKIELPSWVPDWEVHSPSSSFCLSPQFTKWHAAGAQKMSARISTDFSTLEVTGFAVDTVNHVSDSFLEFVPLPGTVLSHGQLRTEAAKKLAQSVSDFFLQQRWRQWDKMARNLEQYPTGEDLSTVFIRTLIADASLAVETTPEMLQDHYAAWCQYWIHASLGEGEYIGQAHDRISPHEKTLATRFMEAHHKAAYSRRFFTTTKGYMGLCPTWTRSGNRVAVLFGGRTPYILKKRSKRLYEFVGECYMHGIMNGESLNSNKSTPEVFSIR